MVLDLNRREFLAFGAAGLTQAVAGRASASDAALHRPKLQNIAARGQVHNGTAAANGSKTRFKGIYRFTIGSGGARSMAPVFANFRISNAGKREVDGASAYTIRKAALSYAGMTRPLRFGGERSVAVPPGTVDLRSDPMAPSDFGAPEFRAGQAAFVRLSLDLPEGQTCSGHANPMYLEGESLLRYDRESDVDDIDGGDWSEPAGTDKWVVFPGPIMLVGEPSAPVTSVLGIGDSILDGSVDNAGDGSAGGGWLRRAAYREGLPCLQISCSGDKAAFVAADNAKTLQLAGYAHAAFIALGNNDIRDGRSEAQLLADLRSIWSLLRKNGIRHISQTQILGETHSKDQTTSISRQTSVEGFEPGGVRSRVNAVIAGLDGGNIDDQIDIIGAVQSDGRWDVPLFETRLVADAPEWSGSVTLKDRPEVGDFLAFDPAGGANADANWPHVASVTGNAPFLAKLTGGPAKFHPAGTLVKASYSADGIHPQQAAHIRMAQKAAPALRRAGAVVSPWAHPSTSFEVDFPNRRAHVGGKDLAISALLACTRPTPGMACDSLTWSGFDKDQLRYSDGGGLHIEAASTNEIRNNTGAGLAADSMLPPGWSMIGGEKLRLTNLGAGMESGIHFVDLAFEGKTEASRLRLALEDAGLIRAAAGETWCHSAFLVSLYPPAGVQSIALGLIERHDADEITAEHLSMPLDLSRHVRRHSFAVTLTDDRTRSLQPVIDIGLVPHASVRLGLRIGLPQLERASEMSSPITTSGVPAMRAADTIDLKLPAGIHDLAITFDDGTRQTAAGKTGVLKLTAAMLDGTVISTISGVRTS